jgi:hypothetical protein
MNTWIEDNIEELYDNYVKTSKSRSRSPYWSKDKEIKKFEK